MEFWTNLIFTISILITCFFEKNLVSGIDAPFISSWYSMELNAESPIVIPHPLNELPVKVDVQVKVNYDGTEYIFPGLGSAQRDDDIATDFGGVGYIYNDIDVKLFIPVAQSNGNGQGWVITTGGSVYSGPFVGAFTVCEVRIRAWRKSDWPTPNYFVETTISTSAPYKNVAHNLGVYPDFVTVQLILSTGYVSEAQGTTPTTLNHGTKWINTCGTIFGITDSTITLWGASEDDDFLACFKDGWGSEDISYTSATAQIRAWILNSSEILQNDQYTYHQINGHLNPQVPLTSLFDVDFHILVIETKDNTISSGRMFYGAGSASHGEAGESFGGTVYGYNNSHVLLWTPAPSYGYPIYVGGVWGSGADPLQCSSVVVSIKVIATGNLSQVACTSPPSIANGYYVVNNDSAVYNCNSGYLANQTNNIFYCNNSQWEQISLYCKEMMCPTPKEIANAIHISNGTKNGSVALYSCVSGYSGNGESGLITCNGTHWSDTNFYCAESTSASCGIPPAVPHAYITVENNTVAYTCHDGYTANQTNTSINCVNGQWGQPVFSCLNTSCPYPPDIQNAMKLSDGIGDGSSTLYTCMPGFTSNNGQANISCNASRWTSTNFTCLQNAVCGIPPSIPNAYYNIANKTAFYHCYHGYTGSQTNNTIHCLSTEWETPTLSCSNISCGVPVDIPNTVKVSDGFHNGSMTIYSCLPGFSSNNEYPNTTCNGTHWSSVQFACSASPGCGFPPNIPDAYYVMENNTAIYHCLPDYTASQSNDIIYCNNSVWEETSLTCLQIAESTCGLPPTIPNAYYTTDNNTATYHCYHGYSGNQTNTTIRCLNSKWEATTLGCLNFFCGLPPDIPNTVKVSDGFHNGSVTLYSCLLEFSSNNENPSTTCNGSHWSSSQFACSVAKSTCGLPHTIPNAYYTTENNTATYHCYHGYTGNQTNTTIRCANSKWEDITLGCLSISCGIPPYIPNSVKVSDGFHNGSMTLYSCLPGFSSNNEYPNTTCNGSHWSSVQFACSAAYNACGFPFTIPNAYYTTDNNTATYHCYHGYTGNQTNTTIRCVNSQWEASTLSCSNFSCGNPPDIPNSVKVSDGFNNGSITLYSCLPGFSSNNEYPNTSCNGSHWSSVQFACSAANSTCGLPPAIQKAYYTIDNNTATYHCFHGYIGNQTNTTVRCVNSQWEAVTLSCLNFSCGTPPDIPNTVRVSDGFHNGSLTLYSCLPGFSSNNEYPNTTCNGTHWNNVLFACSVPEGTCGLPQKIPNAYYTTDNNTTTYHCYHGYTGNQTNTTIRCVNSQWEAIALGCFNFSCGHPPEIQNSVKVSDGFHNGSVTLYSCLPGFSPNNEYPNTTCNGTRWTDAQFACSGQACSSPPDIPNALKTSNGFINGSSTSYTCMPGYIDNGANPTISCNGTHWTGTLFSCSEDGNLTSNDSALAYALEGLKIPRKMTTTYSRSLNCASDSRPSVQAIGAMGLSIITLFVGLIILADCVSFYQKRRF